MTDRSRDARELEERMVVAMLTMRKQREKLRQACEELRAMLASMSQQAAGDDSKFCRLEWHLCPFAPGVLIMTPIPEALPAPIWPDHPEKLKTKRSRRHDRLVMRLVRGLERRFGKESDAASGAVEGERRTRTIHHERKAPP